MGNLLKIAPRLVVGEHLAAQPGPIERTVRKQAGLAKAGPDLRHGRLPRRDDCARGDVRVRDHDTQFREQRSHCALSRGDSAGDRDYKTGHVSPGLSSAGSCP